ncbi:CBS domain-containing protein [Tropicimonas aquimaris]|uniref:CBS domain-containing protein n=1 Tax=Tropicimonas aquimaris TaxID=914152 RepID=A0ABW3IL61_9RHOB
MSIAPTETVRVACDRLNEANVGALPVLDGDRLVGIISERDVIRRAIGRRRPTAETQVEEIMTREPTTVDLSVSLSDAMRLMIKGKFRHLPVTDQGRVVAMLSMRDIPTEYRLMVERYEEYLTNAPRREPVAAQ